MDSTRTSFLGLINPVEEDLDSLIDSYSRSTETNSSNNNTAEEITKRGRGRPALTIEQKAANKRKREEDKKQKDK